MIKNNAYSLNIQINEIRKNLKGIDTDEEKQPEVTEQTRLNLQEPQSGARNTRKNI